MSSHSEPKGNMRRADIESTEMRAVNYTAPKVPRVVSSSDQPAALKKLSPCEPVVVTNDCVADAPNGQATRQPQANINQQKSRQSHKSINLQSKNYHARLRLNSR